MHPSSQDIHGVAPNVVKKTMEIPADIVLFAGSTRRHRFALQSLNHKDMKDNADLEFFATHLTPDQQNKLVQIIGGKCIVLGKLNNKEVNVLLGYRGPSVYGFRKVFETKSPNKTNKKFVGTCRELSTQ
jgi:hypothetical protein